MKNIIICIMAFLAMLNIAKAQNVGESAPDFTLKDLSNQEYTLSDNKGNVIMVFLIGYSCPFCISSAPAVQSEIINAFSGNANFQALVIDVWNGNASSVQNFKNTTGLNAKFLLKGSSVASSWKTTYDRLVIIDSEGKMAYKGSSAAGNNTSAAKTAVQEALNNIVTTAQLQNTSDQFELGWNYPNPMRDETKINFRIKEAGIVNLVVYDLTGKAVMQVVNEFFPAGEHIVSIQRNNLKKGIYFYKMDVGNFTSTKKMIVQ